MPEAKQTSGLKETLLSLFLLGVIVSIGMGIYFEQYRFYSALIEQMPRKIHEKQAAPKLTGTKDESIFSRLPLPEGVVFLSASEVFDASTLSDKINGKAELYLGAGFVCLETRRFCLKGGSDAWMEVFLYEMKDAQSAFAVYSLQKRSGAIPTDLGQRSYQTTNALFIVFGPYYMELVASAENTALQAALRTLGQALIAGFPVLGKPVAEPKLFPPEGLDPQSIMLIASDAFGFEKLNKVFTAGYRIDGMPLTAFVSRRSDPGEAHALAEAYRAFLLQFDAESLTVNVQPGEEIFAFSMMGQIEVVFSLGPYLAGVHQASDAKRALDLVKNLRDYLIKINET
ncbi:MAG: hypothetical protein COS92_07685 [Desulfobacterales bacterium CG07_land_8_20_14_0_80_52_14]|nr:MAG: hypothetical protein COX20_12190 [Desulfobacterales bacterium CG23_combo_of_CG06-09_8_20_14_all_52_9]PIU49246.1 MAG: hypothetical protein COS92_07685 [Desulfobacterales bacterium CG07_land_8_20_14_0_80_52_14]